MNVINNKEKVKIPYFTIAIPAFNGKNFLKESVKSVLNQTYRDFELVIIDDHSTDGAWEYIQTINDPRVRIFRNEKNLGIVLNWKRCIEEAKGKWFKFLMSDDIMFPDSLDILKKIIDEYPTNNVIVTSGVGFNKKENIKKYLNNHPREINNMHQYLKPINKIINERKKFNQTWAMPNSYTLPTAALKSLIKTEKYKEVEKKLGQTGHCVDYFILYAVATKYKTMIEMGVPLYGVRSHESNLSKSYNQDLLYHLDGDKYIHYILYDYKGFEHFYMVRHAFRIYLNKLFSNKRKLFTIYPLRWTYKLIVFLFKHFFNIEPL